MVQDCAGYNCAGIFLGDKVKVCSTLTDIQQQGAFFQDSYNNIIAVRDIAIIVSHRAIP